MTLSCMLTILCRRMCRCGHKKKLHASGASGAAAAGGPEEMAFMWRFPRMGYPQAIYFNRMFHYKSSILGRFIYGNPRVNH